MDGLTFKNCTIALIFSSTSFFNVYNTRVLYSSTAAIGVRNTATLLVENSEFFNNSLAIQHSGIGFVTVTHSLFESNGKQGIAGACISLTQRSNLVSKFNKFQYNFASSSSAISTNGGEVLLDSDYYYNNTGGRSAVSSFNGKYTVVNCTFEKNAASGAGGVAEVSGSPNFVVQNSTFLYNSAGSAGCILMGMNGYGLIETSTFIENKVTSWGGALFISQATSNFTIRECKFIRNGGAFGGAIALQHESFVSIHDSEFDGNWDTTVASGLYTQWSGAFLITNSSFVNHREAIRSAFAHEVTPSSIINCTFAHNRVAMFIDQGNLSVIGTSFTNHSSSSYFNMFRVKLLLSNSNFYNSTTCSNRYVSCISFSRTEAEVYNVTVLNHSSAGNSISLSESNVTIKGFTMINCGPLASPYSNGNLTLSDSSFIGNPGRALSLFGDSTITNILCERNSAPQGGCLYTGPNSNITVSSSTFLGNIADSYGGALLIEGNTIVKNCTFSHNRARLGGAIMIQSSLIADELVVMNNNATRGGGVFINSTSQCIFVKLILFFNYL